MDIQLSEVSSVKTNVISLGITMLIPVEEQAQCPDGIIKWEVVEALNKAGYVVMKVELKRIPAPK